VTTNETLTAWFRGRIPDGWYAEPVTVRSDRDEILVTGVLTPPELGDDLGPDAQRVALASRIAGHREATREASRHRQEAEHRFDARWRGVPLR
jgi:hypothetical protein